MKYFLRKIFQFALYALFPFLIAIGFYAYYDPFKVLYDYDSLYLDNGITPVAINQDYVSTTTFIKNNDSLQFNSFVFGNSRSTFYQFSEWKKYLERDAVCYHFDASGEALWAINKKLEYIDKQGNQIKNVLLILDYTTLEKDQPKKGNHLGIISPALVDNDNFLEFHFTFLKAFLSPDFLYAFSDYKISGKIKPYMVEKSLLDNRPRNYNSRNNEIRFDHYENLIDSNEYYTKERMSSFYKRDTTKDRFSDKTVFESQIELLENIRSIFQKHETSVKVIINPLYDQKRLVKSDLEHLNKIFGDKNVFDFSGRNKFTNDYRNYYEYSHYRPHVASDIMNIIYQGQFINADTIR